MRYRCVGCKRAFTRYPQGVDCNGRSVRLRALMWALGLSHRLVGCVLTALGQPASRISGWRTVQVAKGVGAGGLVIYLGRCANNMMIQEGYGYGWQGDSGGGCACVDAVEGG